MSENRSAPPDLTRPVRAAAARLRQLPGAGVVARVADETLDRVGVVSPKSRRIVAYAGAGLLGVAGAIEWPIAVTGAAVVWLTQSRDEDEDVDEAAAGRGAETGSAGRNVESASAGTERAAPDQETAPAPPPGREPEALSEATPPATGEGHHPATPGKGTPPASRRKSAKPAPPPGTSETAAPDTDDPTPPGPGAKLPATKSAGTGRRGTRQPAGAREAVRAEEPLK
ncbi:hypothetical protein [Streptomyces indicus]|uniref:Uncharacterized protein n=1 Tax=Streptomyces indicus TaxID=417292 RepID=A0A1G9AU66_9ACTN|nr:hypothetical protein [Streptomyces indicus]SDK30180.1 hypothetical protein SAMN05421806_106125 [Streptomyces indicus]